MYCAAGKRRTDRRPAPVVPTADALGKESSIQNTAKEAPLREDEQPNHADRIFKTSGRRYSESGAATTLQASCYVHAVQERFDELVGIRYVVLVKTKLKSSESPHVWMPVHVTLIHYTCGVN